MSQLVAVVDVDPGGYMKIATTGMITATVLIGFFWVSFGVSTDPIPHPVDTAHTSAPVDPSLGTTEEGTTIEGRRPFLTVVDRASSLRLPGALAGMVPTRLPAIGSAIPVLNGDRDRVEPPEIVNTQHRVRPTVRTHSTVRSEARPPVPDPAHSAPVGPVTPSTPLTASAPRPASAPTSVVPPSMDARPGPDARRTGGARRNTDRVSSGSTADAAGTDPPAQAVVIDLPAPADDTGTPAHATARG